VSSSDWLTPGKRVHAAAAAAAIKSHKALRGDVEVGLETNEGRQAGEERDKRIGSGTFFSH